MIVVLDASAISAYLKGEAGADINKQYVELGAHQLYIHALNLCEVYCGTLREAGEDAAEKVISDLIALGVKERDDLDPTFWRVAADLKAKYRRVSLADCCALSLSSRLGAVLATADRHEMQVLADEGSQRIEFIRLDLKQKFQCELNLPCRECGSDCAER